MKIEDFIEKYQGTVDTNFADSGLGNFYSDKSFTERAENNLSKLINLQKSLEIAQHPTAKARIQKEIDALQGTQDKFGAARIPIGTPGRGGTEIMQTRMERMDLRPEFKEEADRIAEEKKIEEELKRKTQEEKDKKEEREAFLDSPKGRMQTIFNDADKRDAILGGIADAMLETRTGEDAYGNRFNRAQKNVRDNLKIAEATDIARQKAQLDAMKTMAETTKLIDPRQYLTNAQTEADSFVKAQIRAGKIKAEDYDTAYASMLKQIAVKDLTSAKASSISTLFTYAQALQQSDPVTAGILMDAIKSNAIYLAGDSSGGGASGEVVIDATEYNKKKEN